METSELIERLAAEAAPADRGAVPRRLVGVALAGLLGAAVMLLAWLHVRPDLAEAVATWKFWLKLGYASALGLAGYLAIERLARPAGSGRIGLGLGLAAVAVLALMGAGQLAFAQPDNRAALWFGRTWRHCPFNILALSGPMMLVGLAVVRSLAPTRLAMAGAATGLFAGGVAMAVYTLHCPETEPAFVATWYSLGAALTVGAGAMLGPLVLRWR